VRQVLGMQQGLAETPGSPLSKMVAGGKVS
jgi:hypothetical protein